jgi:hypothetical protein
MRSLKESLLDNTENTLKAGDDYLGINSFPKKKDFKSHSVMKGSRCTWLCPAFKNIYEKELKEYLNKAVGQSWLLPQYDEITGISVHVAKHGEGIFGIGVFLEGINRGTMTKIGVVIKDISGERETLAKAKDAAYEFLCLIKDDEKFFKDVLKHITTTAYKWVI